MVMTRIGTARTFRNIDQYDTAVQNAVAMADHMQAPVDVVPMDVAEFVQVKTGMALKDYLAGLPDAVREELRLMCIDSCMEILHDCPDAAIRVQAAAVLVALGVVQ
ncbi:hypothetical protein AZ22_4069 [Bordetella bronchiseptica 980-2]|nr:hypothetical protein AZ22_4069 [Bordetella bronchiseptica 980-2]KDB90714.1 hypothetical protein AZ17_4327 [Bordetella bronchiseptica D989]